MTSSPFVELMKQHEALNDFLQLYTAMQQIYHAKLSQCIEQCQEHCSTDSTASLAYALALSLSPGPTPAKEVPQNITPKDLKALVEDLARFEIPEGSATSAELAMALAKSVLDGHERPVQGLILPDILTLLTIATQPEAMFGSRELAQLKSGKLVAKAETLPSGWKTNAGQEALRQLMEQLLLFTFAGTGGTPLHLGEVDAGQVMLALKIRSAHHCESKASNIVFSCIWWLCISAPCLQSQGRDFRGRSGRHVPAWVLYSVTLVIRVSCERMMCLKALSINMPMSSWYQQHTIPIAHQSEILLIFWVWWNEKHPCQGIMMSSCP
jgi:hypothetical protein